MKASGSLLLHAAKLLAPKTRAALFDVLVYHNDDDDSEIRKRKSKEQQERVTER